MLCRGQLRGPVLTPALDTIWGSCLPCLTDVHGKGHARARLYVRSGALAKLADRAARRVPGGVTGREGLGHLKIK